MKLIVFTCYCLVIRQTLSAPPRRNEKHPPSESKDKSEGTGLENLGIEYERYLKEVIDVLESDPEFKRKLEAAEEADIRTGKIAHELDFVDHNVRTKLDEVKRSEIERLRHLAQRQFELTNGIDVDHMKIRPPEHLDHDNPHTFEINDLKKLIAKVTDDLNEADKKRREEFKEYEMQKEFEHNEKLKHLEGAEKESFEKELKDNETKHKQHEPLHHPGSRKQLEEVWEKQDHMTQQEFDPKVFFQLHDLDGNGFWDQNEVKVLFIKELDKMYQAGAPEDDMREREEELERMREHVFKEADKNQDQLISFQEFLDQTKQPEFEKDPAWETVDQQPVYTHEEYQEFERRRQQEIQNMIQQGLIPPQPIYHVPPGYHHSQVQQFPQGHHPQVQQHPPAYQHPNQLPQQQHLGDPGQSYNQVPHGSFNPNVPNQQYHGYPQQQYPVPNQGYHPAQQGHPNTQGFGGQQEQQNPQGQQHPQGFGGPQHAQQNTQGFGGPQHAQQNTQGLGGPQHAQQNTQGFGGPQHAQQNTQGFGGPQHAQQNTQGLGGPQHAQQNTQGFGGPPQGQYNTQGGAPQEHPNAQQEQRNPQGIPDAQAGHQNPQGNQQQPGKGISNQQNTQGHGTNHENVQNVLSQSNAPNVPQNAHPNSIGQEESHKVKHN